MLVELSRAVDQSFRAQQAPRNRQAIAGQTLHEKVGECAFRKNTHNKN
jgi:hypothetical protein